jgi:hypothetical protein
VTDLLLKLRESLLKRKNGLDGDWQTGKLSPAMLKNVLQAVVLVVVVTNDAVGAC